MSLAGLLDHTVHILRSQDLGTEDAEGQPVQTVSVGAAFRAAIQPKSAREMALVSGEGAAIATHTIYLLPRLLTSGDVIIHDTSSCPLADAADLPDGRYEITGVRNAAGRGHHLEVDATAIGAFEGVEGS